jgi:hypothetical protein
VTVTWSSSLFQGDQQRSSLEQAINQLQGVYIDASQLANGSLIQNEYERATDHQVTSTNGVTTIWQALPWLRLNATGGLSTIQRTDETYIPYGVNTASPGSTTGDTTGSYGLGKGTSQEVTLTVGTTIPMPLVNTAVGLNYVSQSTATVSAYTSQLGPGITHPSTFPTTAVNGTVPSAFSQSTAAASTYGWYVQPTVQPISRLYVSPGFRLDGGSASGSHAGLTGFPKIDFSYIMVDQDNPIGFLTLFRPRLAFGNAGTQPSPVDKLRIFNLGGAGITSLDGGNSYVPSVQLSSLGNTQLRPERTSEVEGGFDAALGDDRLQLTMTLYNKTRHDAIISVPVPPSVYGQENIFRNLGIIRNTGAEISLSARVLDSHIMGWTTTANFSHDNSKVVSLNPGVGTYTSEMGYHYAVGYPVGGLWERPIVSYADVNGNGIIEYNEIRLGDSLAFVGQTEPKYQLNLSTNVVLFNSRLSMSADMSYQNGITQVQGQSGAGNGVLLNVPNAPGTSLGTQAALIASIYNQSRIGVMQTVNALRFNSLSINYIASAALTRMFHVPSMSFALQGQNLGLHTSYRGADPNVNAFSTSNAGDIMDAGQIPQPRTWTLTLRLGN